MFTTRVDTKKTLLLRTALFTMADCKTVHVEWVCGFLSDESCRQYQTHLMDQCQPVVGVGQRRAPTHLQNQRTYRVVLALCRQQRTVTSCGKLQASAMRRHFGNFSNPSALGLVQANSALFFALRRQAQGQRSVV